MFRRRSVPPCAAAATFACFACCAAAFRIVAAEPPPSATAPPSAPADLATIRAAATKHCLRCHSGAAPEGKLRLDTSAHDFADAEARRIWTQALRQIESGRMPPEDEPRPSADERAGFTAALRRELRTAELARRAVEGRVVLRRLNRVEYQNTIRDLFGIDVTYGELLPADSAADGFDTAGAAHHTSSFLMERYLEAAETALDLAIVNLPQPPFVRKRLSCKDERHVKVTTEKVFRHTDDALVFFCSSLWQAVGVNQFYPQDGGRYRFRISASAVQSDGEPVTFRVTAGNTRLTGKSGLIGYFDAPPDTPTVFEFERHFDPRTTISILPYGLASAQAVNKIGAEAWDGPGLAVQWVEVEGPLYDAWPPESHRRLFGDLPQKPAPAYNRSKRVETTSERPLVDAERILRAFTRRAFRRSVTDADVRPFVDVVEAKLAADYSFEQAVRSALKGVLLSPDFLFLSERPGPLTDFALASRLSYFLWSTMPDDELLAHAERNHLHDEAVLRAQVERMLEHPKSANLTEHFVGQWLGLRDIDFTEPSHILYPEFDHLLKVSMLRETELFFDEVLRGDLSIANFVDSDFALLNGRLGKHYGVAGDDGRAIEGWEFRKVRLPADSRRGGVLTMASVLKVTANGTTTSPVTRGAWVLDRILGTPAPPPPDDVPAVDPDIRGATTIREQLAKHRSDASCAGCHARIDPAGFALENFDCIGGWRDRYRVTGSGDSVVVDGRRMAYHLGKPVDASGLSAEGEPFRDIDEFKRLLLRDPDQLARALAAKLLTYATGAAPTPIDREEIERIVAAVREKNYGLRSLIHEVVRSELFRSK